MFAATTLFQDVGSVDDELYKAVSDGDENVVKLLLQDGAGKITVSMNMKVKSESVYKNFMPCKFVTMSLND